MSLLFIAAAKHRYNDNKIFNLNEKSSPLISLLIKMGSYKSDINDNISTYLEIAILESVKNNNVTILKDLLDYNNNNINEKTCIKILKIAHGRHYFDILDILLQYKDFNSEDYINIYNNDVGLARYKRITCYNADSNSYYDGYNNNYYIHDNPICIKLILNNADKSYDKCYDKLLKIFSVRNCT